MSGDRWLYNPKFCDYQPCYTDCDKCPIKEKIFKEDEEREQKKKLNNWMGMMYGEHD